MASASAQRIRSSSFILERSVVSSQSSTVRRVASGFGRVGRPAAGRRSRLYAPRSLGIRRGRGGLRGSGFGRFVPRWFGHVDAIAAMWLLRAAVDMTMIGT